jgi:hypothetical protein
MLLMAISLPSLEQTLGYIHLALAALALIGPVIVAILKNRHIDKAATILETLITSIETHEGEGPTKLKALIEDSANKAGISKELERLVDKLTKPD